MSEPAPRLPARRPDARSLRRVLCNGGTQHRGCAPPPQRQGGGTMSLTEHYIPIPTRLATDLRDNPVAIGLYALVARLFFIVQGPVPLSRADLRRYDPCLKEGTAKRALD